jgi:hypothetical protein
MARREDVPVAQIVLGKFPGQVVAIHGFTAAEMIVPLVELTGALEDLQRLTIEQAETLANGLLLAARIARGEVLSTPLDEFLAKRKA